MRFSPRLRSLLAALLLVPALLALSACDSNGDDDVDPADVAGGYSFTQLEFDPQPTSLNTVDILTALNPSATTLELFADGDFSLRYRLAGETAQRQAGGTFGVNESFVVLRFDDSDATEVQRLLMPTEVRLDRDPANSAVLFSQFNRTVNLEQYDDELYAGLQSVAGTLRIRLTR